MRRPGDGTLSFLSFAFVLCFFSSVQLSFAVNPSITTATCSFVSGSYCYEVSFIGISTDFAPAIGQGMYFVLKFPNNTACPNILTLYKSRLTISAPTSPDLRFIPFAPFPSEISNVLFDTMNGLGEPGSSTACTFAQPFTIGGNLSPNPNGPFVPTPSAPFTLSGNVTSTDPIADPGSVACSWTSTLIPGAASRMKFLTGASFAGYVLSDSLGQVSATSGDMIPLPINLIITDGYNNQVTSDNGRQISMSFAGAESLSSTSTAQLIGQTMVTSVNGSATFKSYGIIGQAPKFYRILFAANPPLGNTAPEAVVVMVSGAPEKISYTPVTGWSPYLCFSDLFYFVPNNTAFTFPLALGDVAGNVIPSNVCPTNMSTWTYTNPACIHVFAYSSSLSVTGAPVPLPLTVSSDQKSIVALPYGDPSKIITVIISISCNPAFYNGNCGQSSSTLILSPVAPALMGCYGTDSMSGDCDSYLNGVLPFFEFCVGEMVPSTYCKNVGYYGSMQDVQLFQNQMINPDDLNNLRATLAVASKQRVDVTFQFAKYPHGGIPAQQQSAANTKWAFGSSGTVLQLDDSLIEFLSFFVFPPLSTNVTLKLAMPFCGSISSDMINNLILEFLQSVVTGSAPAARPTPITLNPLASASTTSSSGSSSSSSSSSSTTTTTVSSYSSSYRVLCYGEPINAHYLGFTAGTVCCDSASSICAPVTTLRNSGLIAIHMLPTFLGVLASIYITTLLMREYKDSYALLNEWVPLKILPPSDIAMRRKSRMYAFIFAPIVLWIYILTSPAFLNDRPLLLGLILFLFLSANAFWYAVTFRRLYFLYWRGRRPTPRMDRVFLAAISVVLGLSMTIVVTAFCWVVLGMLLVPEDIASILAGVVTVGFTVVMQWKRLNLVMNRLQLKHRRKVLMANGIDVDKAIEEEDEIVMMILEDNNTTNVVKNINLLNVSADKKEVIIEDVTHFLQSRLRFILINLASTTCLIALFAIFVIVGLKTFSTTNGGLGTAIGSAAIVLGGVIGNLKSKAQNAGLDGENNNNDDQQQPASAVGGVKRFSNIQGGGQVEMKSFGGGMMKQPLPAIVLDMRNDPNAGASGVAAFPSSLPATPNYATSAAGSAPSFQQAAYMRPSVAAPKKL